MSKFKVEDYFNHMSVSPSGLTQGQIVQFNYNSPNGQSDNKPLIYVYEKRIDRVYGINLHYNMAHFTEILQKIENQVTKFLKEQYERNPENRKKLIEEHKNQFSNSLISIEEYNKYMINYPRKQLEEFVVATQDFKNMRQYLYTRMSSVTKLVYKSKKENNSWNVS